MAALSPNSSAIFCVGDNTDLGTQAEYDLLLKNIEEAGVELPPMYYAIGGHDVYTNAYDQEIERFLEKSDMTVYLVLYDPASVAMGERLFGDVEALP